jgi:hypothetical protein
MKDIKFTIYDWLGYLIPGTVLLTSIYFVFLDKSELVKVIDFPDFILGFLLFCIAYIAGHLVHSIANYTIDLLPYGKYAPIDYFKREFSKDFNDSQINRLIQIFNNKYGLIKDDSGSNIEFINKNYWLCYTNVIDKRPDSLIQVFLSLNGLYRGICISCLLSSIILLFKCDLTNGFSEMIIWSVILLFISFMFYLRAKRFKIYLTRTVYTDFISLNNQII